MHASDTLELSGEASVVPIVTISLKRATGRRAEFVNQAKAIGVEFAFLDATDGFQGTPSDWLCAEPVDGMIGSIDDRPLSITEAACTHSHHRAWRALLAADSPGAIILEDDVSILQEGRGVFEFLQSTAEAWRERNAVIYLSSGHLGGALATHVLGSRTAVSVPGGSRFMRIRRFRGPLWGSSGYFITNRAARALLAREASLVRLPDAWRQRVQEGTLSEMWLTQPPCLFHPDDRGKSFIEPGRQDVLLAGEPDRRGPSLKTHIARKLSGLVRRALLDPCLRLLG